MEAMAMMYPEMVRTCFTLHFFMMHDCGHQTLRYMENTLQDGGLSLLLVMPCSKGKISVQCMCLR